MEKVTRKIEAATSTLPRNMENTLTIDVSKEEIPDVFHDPSWPLFSKEKALLVQDIPIISLVRFIANANELTDLALLDSICGSSLLPVLFNNKLLDNHWRVWLFVAHSSWQRKSRITLYKRLWTSFLGERMESFKRQNEFMFESPEGIRFAGLAEVTAENFLLAVQLMSQHGHILLVSDRKDIASEKSIEFVFQSAYPKYKGVEQGTINIATLSARLCPLGDIVVRISSSYDERISSLDCVMLTDNPKLAMFT